jgi:predicted DNA-binding protein
MYSKLPAMATKREITIRVTEQEFELLESHCEATGRTKTELLREFIRSLRELPLKGQRSDSSQE